MSGFDPKIFLELVRKEKCTHTVMVPVQFQMIMGQPDFADYDLSSLELMVSMGAALPKETKAHIIDRFQTHLLELYGLTEGVATILNPEEMKGKIGSVGRPIASTDIRIVDHDDKELPRGEKGEIVGYASALMRGYYKQPEKTVDCIWKDEQGRTYLKTGDIGRLDNDGYLYIMDRKKDMINSGGYNIYACDLEEIITRHDAVKEAAVIAVPHEKWSETPLALVIPQEGAAASGDEIKEWVNSQVALKRPWNSRQPFRTSPAPCEITAEFSLPV
jgi:acyl-CoA synthetase (AMP-forming)/AMP-acid ligase II